MVVPSAPATIPYPPVSETADIIVVLLSVVIVGAAVKSQEEKWHLRVSIGDRGEEEDEEGENNFESDRKSVV